MKLVILTLLFTFLTHAHAAKIENQDVQGTWYLNIHESLKEANYQEGHRYFYFQNLQLKINNDVTEASFSGTDHAFFERGFDAIIKNNKLVLERQKTLIEKTQDQLSGDDKFNYTKKKILITQNKSDLIVKVRPDQGEKELEMVFSRTPNATPRKAFKVKYNTLYVSEEPINGKNWTLTFNQQGSAELVTDKGAQILPFTIAWSKKVFLGEGEYLVKSFSKALNVYSKEHDKMYAFWPQ